MRPKERRAGSAGYRYSSRLWAGGTPQPHLRSDPSSLPLQRDKIPPKPSPRGSARAALTPGSLLTDVSWTARSGTASDPHSGSDWEHTGNWFWPDWLPQTAEGCGWGSSPNPNPQVRGVSRNILPLRGESEPREVGSLMSDIRPPPTDTANESERSRK